MREASRGFTVKFVQIYFDTVIEAGRTTAAGFFLSGPAPVSFSSGHRPAAVVTVGPSLFPLYFGQAVRPAGLIGSLTTVSDLSVRVAPQWRAVIPYFRFFLLFQRVLSPSYRPLSAFFFVLFQEKLRY